MWLRLRNATSSLATPASFTVVVPFRNEAHHLPSLFRFFSEHAPNTSVVWVNDHSTDHGAMWLADQLALHPQHTLLHCGQHEQGKKAALRKAIAQRDTEWIVTIDADVQLRLDWETALSSELASSNAEMLVLPVSISGTGRLAQWQQCEMLALTGLAGASAQSGEALLANGAHLAFRRKSYLDYVAANEDTAYSSGDDMFLLHYLRLHERPITYAALHALVATVQAEHGKTLWHQRVRWAGKMSAHSHPSQLNAMLALAVGNVAPWLALCTFKPLGIFTCALLLVLKFWIDLSFCEDVARKLRVTCRGEALLSLQCVYPFYLIAVFIASRFYTPLWKGRVVSLPPQ